MRSRWRSHSWPSGPCSRQRVRVTGEIARASNWPKALKSCRDRMGRSAGGSAAACSGTTIDRRSGSGGRTRTLRPHTECGGISIGRDQAGRDGMGWATWASKGPSRRMTRSKPSHSSCPCGGAGLLPAGCTCAAGRAAALPSALHKGGGGKEQGGGGGAGKAKIPRGRGHRCAAQRTAQGARQGAGFRRWMRSARWARAQGVC